MRLQNVEQCSSIVSSYAAIKEGGKYFSTSDQGCYLVNSMKYFEDIPLFICIKTIVKKVG